MFAATERHAHGAAELGGGTSLMAAAPELASQHAGSTVRFASWAHAACVSPRSRPANHGRMRHADQRPRLRGDNEGDSHEPRPPQVEGNRDNEQHNADKRNCAARTPGGGR
jgi:hypothetical protein